MKKITVIICIILFLLLIALLVLNGNIGYFRKSSMNVYWAGFASPPLLCNCFGIKINNHCLGVSFDCNIIN